MSVMGSGEHVQHADDRPHATAMRSANEQKGQLRRATSQPTPTNISVRGLNSSRSCSKALIAGATGAYGRSNVSGRAPRPPEASVDAGAAGRSTAAPRSNASAIRLGRGHASLIDRS